MIYHLSASDHLSLIPACFSILLRVPIGISRFGCGTVVRPCFVGCWNCLWLPTWLTWYQPSFSSSLITSRLFICRSHTHIRIHTFSTPVKEAKEFGLNLFSSAWVSANQRRMRQ